LWLLDKALYVNLYLSILRVNVRGNKVSEPEKITIVEGPTPDFEPNSEPCILAMSEGPEIPYTTRCILRTFNGGDLLNRCRTAWEQGRAAYLEFTNMSGITEEALILAARLGEVEAGEVLNLWVRLENWPSEFPDSNDHLDV
tara:strand:+ start:8114 stop:8539 length:426 start_codon:yes stop_codon:yes gene_type:complete